MKEELEKFISQNKSEFDDKAPSKKVWMKIREALFLKGSLWNSLPLWRAAAVMFLGLSIFLLIPKLTQQRQQSAAMKEFGDVEAFYVKQISEKVDLIYEYRGVEKGLNGFTQDFQQLEAMYYVLKEEMKVHSSEQVKDALVLNLLVRIDLLNQQLHKIESNARKGKAGKEEDIPV